MKSPLHRIRAGAFLLATIVVLAVVGYQIIGGYSWLESVWMVVVTISSVGYAERSQADPSLQIFTIAVILLGMTASAYTFGGFIQLVLAGELDRIMGQRRMKRELEQLEAHVIICGFGRIGELLANDLARQGWSLVVIDSDEQRIEAARSIGHLCLEHDATEESVLTTARVDTAKTLFTGLPSDAANVFITLTARNLNPNLLIISRADQVSTEKKLRQAGADKIVMPTIIGAHHVERMITRPSTADLMELMSESRFSDLELDEVYVTDPSPLAGVTVQETEAHRRHRLLVVAIKQPDGELVLNPAATHRFEVGEVLMVMGRSEDIDQFRELYRS